MSRRRKRQRVLIIDWTPDWDEAFDLVPEGYEPPAAIKLHRAAGHVTAVARFRSPTGHAATVKVRLEREGGKTFRTDQSLSMSFRTPAKGPAA